MTIDARIGRKTKSTSKWIKIICLLHITYYTEFLKFLQKAKRLKMTQYNFPTLQSIL